MENERGQFNDDGRECIHHWLLDERNFGICKKCAASKQFCVRGTPRASKEVCIPGLARCSMVFQAAGADRPRCIAWERSILFSNCLAGRRGEWHKQNLVIL